MRERRFGHIVNISSMGVQINTPRFSAYVASKNALDGFSRSIASEIVDDGVAITTVYMPLVRTPMIEPTDHLPLDAVDQPRGGVDDGREGDREPAEEAVDDRRADRRDHLLGRAQGPGRADQRRDEALPGLGDERSEIQARPQE